MRDDSHPLIPEFPMVLFIANYLEVIGPYNLIMGSNSSRLKFSG